MPIELPPVVDIAKSPAVWNLAVDGRVNRNKIQSDEKKEEKETE